MQEIAEWLDKLGMSEYAQRFAENEIGVAALRHLTDQDLKDIGVLLGHRRVMLAAIGELGGPAAQLSAVRLAGDINAGNNNDVTLDELLVTIKSEMVKLGPLIGLDLRPGQRRL